MSLIVSCDQCGKKFKVGDDKAGKKIKCQCGGVMTVPQAAAADVDPWDAEPAAPPAPSRSRLPAPVVGRKSPSKSDSKKKSASSGGAPVGLIIGIVAGVLMLGGGAAAWFFLRDKPAAAPVADNTSANPVSQPEAGPGSPPAVATASNDFRKYVPADAQLAVFFQPQKVLHSKILTSIVPKKVISDFLTNAKRGAPLDPESIANVAVFYSPAPAGFPADKVDSDPTAYISGIIQFNDSQKMKDRLQKFLANAPVNVTNALPGPAWWVSRKDFSGEGEVVGEKKMVISSAKRGYMRHKGEDGKDLMYEMDENHKPTGKGYTDAELRAKQQKEREDFIKEHETKTAPNRRSSENPEAFDVCLFAPDEQTLVVGLKVRVDAIARGGAPSEMRDVLQEANLAHELILAGARLDEFKPPTKAISQLPGGAQAAMPLMMASQATSQIKNTLIQVGVSPGASLFDLQLTAKDDATAEQFQKQIEEGKKSGKNMAAPLAATQPGENSPGNQLLDEIDKTWKLTRTGAQVRLSIPHTQKLNDLTIAAVKPAADAAKTAAARTEDRNNFKQIGLAAHNYESAYARFPPRGYEDDRKTLPPEKQVGWLFDILPFIEQNNLYNEIQNKLPWDDPANKKAGSTVISAYLNSESPMELVNGYAPSHIVGIAGVGANGPNEPLTSKTAGIFAYSRKTMFRSAGDGTSNTIMAAQAYKNFGPWIANNNATIRPFTQKPYLNGPDGIGGPGGNTTVLMVDGSVRTLSNNTDPSIIEAMATMNGGEPNP